MIEQRKIVDKAMIRNRYNRIPYPPITRHRTGKEHKQLRRHKVKQHKRKGNGSALSQQMSTRLSETKSTKRLTGIRRTMTIRIHHNRSTALERSVICYLTLLFPLSMGDLLIADNLHFQPSTTCICLWDQLPENMIGRPSWKASMEGWQQSLYRCLDGCLNPVLKLFIVPSLACK